ncbi:hypothetical protein [Synechococcus sp. PCC 7336]|nr:hypothetical protein [Synechococcus sp. PCC 7336]
MAACGTTNDLQRAEQLQSSATEPFAWELDRLRLEALAIMRQLL